MSKGFEVYIESGRKTLAQLDNYSEVARRVKAIVKRVWKDSKVYVFGSAAEGKCTAMSDIDILVVVDGVSRDQADRIKAEIYRTIDAPIEVHVASSWEFNHWYRRFINKLEEID